LGKAAIASARAAYQIYKDIFGSKRFKVWKQKGAKPQRLFMGKYRNKERAYSDVKYVKALIGPDTVNTVPMQTLDAFRDHGKPSSRLEKKMDKAQFVLQQLNEIGIDLKSITSKIREGRNRKVC
jgi:transaldolase/transaldolase/glucose-6-phosphate isomerase